MKKDKRKSFGGGYSRFCMQCGIRPPPGKVGYTRGCYIMKSGVASVVCISGECLSDPAHDASGRFTLYCMGCWAGTREGKEMQREKEAKLQQEREKREKRREEREQRRREGSSVWGSEYEGTDEKSLEDISDNNSYFEFCQTHVGGGDWRDVLP